MIKQEFQELNIQTQNLLLSIKNKTNLPIELENYLSIIKFLKNSINEKLAHFIINDNNHRQKRGLINGLGSILKGITGNLDAQDGENFKKILKHLENNYFDLRKQVENQYSLSRSLITNFNNTVADIQHDQNVIKYEIEQIIGIGNNYSTQIQIINAKDICNQLIISYNAILNVFERIEDSLSFCKLKVLHPSIINSKDLFNELLKISPFYTNQLPFEVTYENILNLESLMSVHCKIQNLKIFYFISVPINFEKSFELFYTLPIPTKSNSKYLTIIPHKSYFLKSIDNSIVMALNDMCLQGQVYQCQTSLISNTKTDCEQQILVHENFTTCQYTEINFQGNHIEYIADINQYLAVLQSEEKNSNQLPRSSYLQNPQRNISN